MSTKLIIRTLITLLLISVTLLAFIEFTARMPKHLDGSWTVSFVDPLGESYDFLIENNTPDNDFVFRIAENDFPRFSKRITVEPGSEKIVSIENLVFQHNTNFPEGWQPFEPGELSLKEDAVLEIAVEHGKESKSLKK